MMNNKGSQHRLNNKKEKRNGCDIRCKKEPIVPLKRGLRQMLLAILLTSQLKIAYLIGDVGVVSLLTRSSSRREE